MHTEFILKWACHASEVSNLYEHQLSLNLYKNWLAFPLQESFAVECTCFANLTFIPEMFEIWIQMSGFWNLNCSKAEKGEPRLRPGFRATTWRTPCPRAATRCAGSSISPARPATASHALDASMYYYICSSQANSNEDEFCLACFVLLGSLAEASTGGRLSSTTCLTGSQTSPAALGFKLGVSRIIFWPGVGLSFSLFLFEICQIYYYERAIDSQRLCVGQICQFYQTCQTSQEG